jgi:hypothetical protein
MNTKQGLLPIPSLCKVPIIFQEGIIVTVEMGILAVNNPWTIKENLF